MIRKQMIYMSLTIALISILSGISCGETARKKTLKVKLVSYDVLNRYEYAYSAHRESVWLRFKIEYDEVQFTIEDIDIQYSGPHEREIGSLDMLSESDPAIYDYRFGCIRMKDHVDNSYIGELIRNGHMTAQILLRDKKNDDEWTVECDVDSKNAVMETETEIGAYEITINKYSCVEIDASNLYLDTKLRMYIDTHSATKCYRIKLYGKERRKNPYKAICGVEFYSLSPYLFLERNGGVGNISVSEWFDAYDLLDETEKIISFEGILLVDDADAIRESVLNAEMVVTYSTEYAGSFDTSDAGDRFNGPRKVSPIVVSDALIEE